jgi:TolB-like protein/Flp pilus assembly protein TadD
MQNIRKIPKARERRGPARSYEFGPFRADLTKRLLLRDGELVALTPKAFETLVVLLEHGGEVLLKEELIERVWPDTVVEEGSLNRNISTLRKVLGEAPNDHRYIVTVPGRGYRFVGELREVRDSALRDIRGVIESLAVLPFLNLTGDPDQEYVADGLTEALITDLAQIRALHVVSRTSVMRFKNAHAPLPDIARELGVDGVVEGSVMRTGRRMRITVQLIEARTDRHLWANVYEGDLGDILGLQSAVARAILKEIRVVLTPDEEVRMAAVRVVSPSAYEAYLRGRHFWNQRTLESLKRSETYFEQAIRLDSGYALAHVALAQNYLVMLDYEFRSPQAMAPKAMQAAQRALDLDAELGQAHTALALLRLVCEWDFAGAEAQFRSALDLSPGDSTSHQWYGVLLMYQRRFAESLQQMQQAQSLDPLSPIIRAALGFVYVLAGKADEAIAQGESARELDPSSPQAHAVVGLARQQRGEHRRAIAEFERYVELSDRDPTALMRLGCACADAGDEDSTRAILDEVRERRAHGYVSPGSIAALERALGDSARALSELEAGIEQRATSLLMLAADPAFASLRPDPRFQTLLARIGLPAAPQEHARGVAVK